MKHVLNFFRLLLLASFLSAFFLLRNDERPSEIIHAIGATKLVVTGEKIGEESEHSFTQERILHEYKMLRNPVTGAIPRNYREMELKVAAAIPSKNRTFDQAFSRVMSVDEAQNQNNYKSVGPNNVGGRSRTLAFDQRNAGIMLTGGVSGGIFKSNDGGANWRFVSPENDIRSVTSIVQDPVNPNTWYCGTGEMFGVYSSQNTVSSLFGHGVFKSTNNGDSWSKLASTADAAPHNFNGQFDLVHRMAVHPTTSHVYAAVHNRIMRSTNGGQSWTTVLGGTVANSGLTGLTEIVINPDGSKIFAAFNGDNADRNLAGVWESVTGDSLTANNNAWRRIAGGSTGRPDSIATWLPYRKYSRMVLALAPSSKLFVLYKNDKEAGGNNPLPEADLFRCDFSSGNPDTYVWENLNAYVPNEPAGKIEQINPYTTQFSGFNMSIAVKPDNENILFIGGTCVHRVDLTQTDPAKKFRRAGGYGKGFFPDGDLRYPNHHPDIHGIYFSSANNMFTASDGGIHKSVNIMADTVRWTELVKGLQTLQYQFINIMPDPQMDWIIGGAHDNGTLYNLNAPSFQDHEAIGSGGDGMSAAMSQFIKTGNTWKQSWYTSVYNGTMYRLGFTWQFNPSNNSLNGELNTFDKINPTGYDDNGQWLTLFINDTDSTEHLYYNNQNKVFRTTNSSAVTQDTWTEMTGVGNTIPSTADVSAMAVSKKRNGNKYLYMGTNAGTVYRLTNPNNAAAATVPVNITPSAMTANSYVAGISVNPRNPDTVMVVVSNYDDGTNIIRNVFWTGNATAASPAWQIIEGALRPLSSQSCAIVVKTTGVEYYVGTSVGLYSTTTLNGDNTVWVNEGSGMMKTAIIRSLVNRQQDNNLVVGTHGNGAFLAEIGQAVVIPPDLATGVNDIVRNNRNFIKLVFPTLTRNDVYFRIGQLNGITRINCRVLNASGQLLYETDLPYSDGTLGLHQLPAGNYLLMITSSNNKYQHIARFTKQ